MRIITKARPGRRGLGGLFQQDLSRGKTRDFHGNFLRKTWDFMDKNGIFMGKKNDFHGMLPKKGMFMETRVVVFFFFFRRKKWMFMGIKCDVHAILMKHKLDFHGKQWDTDAIS